MQLELNYTEDDPKLKPWKVMVLDPEKGGEFTDYDRHSRYRHVINILHFAEKLKEQYKESRRNGIKIQIVHRFKPELRFRV